MNKTNKANLMRLWLFGVGTEYKFTKNQLKMSKEFHPANVSPNQIKRAAKLL